MNRIWLVVAALSAGLLLGGDQRARAEPGTIDLTQWTPPNINMLGDDPSGKLVRYGHKLFTDTANEIGPGVSDPAKRLAGNNLACENCHLRAGTQPYAMPLMGVWGQFPQYRAREGTVDTLEERINGCMQRSMNGRALSGSAARAGSSVCKVPAPRSLGNRDYSHPFGDIRDTPALAVLLIEISPAAISR
jgi:thiosulfate dehydrogenase